MAKPRAMIAVAPELLARLKQEIEGLRIAYESGTPGLDSLFDLAAREGESQAGANQHVSQGVSIARFIEHLLDQRDQHRWRRRQAKRAKRAKGKRPRKAPLPGEAVNRG